MSFPKGIQPRRPFLAQGRYRAAGDVCIRRNRLLRERRELAGSASTACLQRELGAEMGYESSE